MWRLPNIKLCLGTESLVSFGTLVATQFRPSKGFVTLQTHVTTRSGQLMKKKTRSSRATREKKSRSTRAGAKFVELIENLKLIEIFYF
jgi:hypothetical protein